MRHNFTAGKLSYKIGDATIPITSGHKLIIHCCNDVGAWGAGFVLALSKRWKKPEESYRRWYRSQINFKLGEVQEVRVQSDISVINMIGQKGVGYDEDGNPPIRYEAIEKCLTKVAEIAKDNGSGVVAPRFGSALSGGSWDKIEELVIKTLIDKGINVTIYDLPEDE
jgi:hypothetical protein